MKGLDTNLLVRYLTADEPAQFEAVERIFKQAEEHDERLFVNVIVLCELAWTLRGKRYRLERSDIATAIGQLLEIPLFEIAHRARVLEALNLYREGRADFADYLIGQINTSAGCHETLTFDSKLSGTEGFEKLGV